MTATAAISRDKVLTGPQLHQAVDQYVNPSIALHLNVLLTVMCRDRLTADAQSGYNVHQNRDSFQERALRDVTMSSNDSALMLDPNNPILVREEMKAQKERLKAVKASIEDMRTESVKLAEENAKRHEGMTQQLVEAQTLQKQIRDMELELARIKATHPPENRMTVNQANDTLDSQIVEIQQLTDEREATQAQIDQTREAVARTAKERLGRDREREEARAKEVREGREAGDTKVDDICRWLTSSISFYRSLLGIRSVQAVSDTELHLEYDVPQGPIILVMKFDELTKRFADAALVGSDIDVAEAVGIAAGSNDVPGLIADWTAMCRTMLDWSTSTLVV
ncbi:hypothetical protein LQV05_004191 [Cryptococcus neoformans]|nr:hypothetical protein LQV05_004191 [Cryptococcus neoformans]